VQSHWITGYTMTGLQMPGYNAWDTLFECLQAQPRRRLLTGLAARQPTDMVHFTNLRDDESAPGAPIHAEYVHIHLPKVAAAGYILWDEQTHKVNKGRDSMRLNRSLNWSRPAVSNSPMAGYDEPLSRTSTSAGQLLMALIIPTRVTHSVVRNTRLGASHPMGPRFHRRLWQRLSPVRTGGRE